jgi:hypothetical protein
MCFESFLLFAWSSHGHAQLTNMGVAIALARMVAFGATYFIRQANKYSINLLSYGQNASGQLIDRAVGDAASLGMVKHYNPDFTNADVDGTEFRKSLAEELKASVDPANAMNLLSDLGNIPGKGERLEHDSQVRHFMRSRDDVTSDQAYLASRAYIKGHLVKAADALGGSLADAHGFWGKVGDAFDLSAGGRGAFFRDGLEHLGAALHTLQDSYAPGHVQRNASEIIEKVNIWDPDNQNAHDDWEGHHAYDEPTNRTSSPHFHSARTATADTIYAVLADLDKGSATVHGAIENVMSARMIAVCKQ